MSAFSLSQEVVVITGGGTGIGLGIARSMSTAGARVVITGRREAVLKEAVSKMENASYYVQDVAELAAVPSFVEKIETEVGPVHTLVNNAGIHNKAWAVDTQDDVFQKIMQTNVNAVFALSREVGRKMISRQDGNIIMISALAGLFGIDRVVAYGTSKTAIIGMMNMLVTEYSKSNVRVNTIAPGWIESEMFFKATDTDPGRKQKISNRIAMEGFGKPEDIGNAAVFLASRAARYVTGVVLPVDGGARVNF